MSYLRVGAISLGVLLAACGSEPDDAQDATGGGSEADTAQPADGSGSVEGTTSQGADDGGTAASSTGEADTGESPPQVDPEPSAGCGASAMRPGSQTELMLEFDGVQRSYDLFLPDGYDGETPVSLVFNFHGFGSNPGEQTFFSEMSDIAAARGFAVAYPAGLDDSWNAGSCCGDSMSGDVDDVGFVRALVDELDASLCIDRRRVFATGMSNGGFLSHRLGCEASDIFAAIAPVAGVLGIPAEDCMPSRVVPIHRTHGTLDQLVPYDGGGLTDSPSVRDSIEGWVERNGCGPDSTVTFDVDPVVCQTWSGCGEYGEVVLCTAEGVGHCWPGNEVCPFGESTTVMHASEAMADFFEQHPMR